ncbi:MAG TPA: hypothetical protein VI229_01635 [Burkholderiales bacterium]
MNLSPRIAAFAAAPFTVLCLGMAINGWLSLAEIADPQQLADARGYIGFWLFLGLLSVLCGAGCWWLMGSQRDQGDA